MEEKLFLAAPHFPALLPLQPQRKTLVVTGDHFCTGVMRKQPAPSCIILLRGHIIDSLLVMKHFHVRIKRLKNDVQVGCFSGSMSPLAVASSCHLRVVKSLKEFRENRFVFLLILSD